DRLGGRVNRLRHPRRGLRRHPRRDRRGLTPLPGGDVMPSALLTPRAEPGHLLPAIAGGAVLLLALPVFLIAGWPIKGWALATVLYVAVHALDYAIARTVTGNGARVFGVFFKSIGLLVVLVAVASSDKGVGI